MRNPPSSIRAEPWYAHRWPWLIFGGPFVVVVASLATAWIAVRTDDGVISGDYYKQGLLVNRRLPAVAQPTPHFAATIVLDGARLAVRPEAGDIRGDTLGVSLVHAASGMREVVVLERSGNGDFAGVLRNDRQGRWIVTFDSRDWPLPTTILDRGAAPTSVRVATSGSIR